MTLRFLDDGSPVCAKCSYVCTVCKLEINDEAITTGDDSYHATCFTCRSCHKRIEELVFAKTSQGIYCMDCHNDRVARSRRRAEHKQSKNKSKRAKEALQNGTDGRPPVCLNGRRHSQHRSTHLTLIDPSYLRNPRQLPGQHLMRIVHRILTTLLLRTQPTIRQTLSTSLANVHQISKCLRTLMPRFYPS